MKKRITTFIALLVMSFFALSAQDDGDGIVNNDTGGTTNLVTPTRDAPVFNKKARTFEEEAHDNDISTRTFASIPGIENGYYVISGVYSKGGRKLDKTVQRLVKKGFDAGFINNPENKLNYVYLQHSSGWRSAIQACVSDFDGDFTDTVWVLKIGDIDQEHERAATTSSAVAATKNPTKENPILEEVSYEMLNDLNEETATSQILNETPSKSKLIQKADYYFDKMWYAEAAVLYEQALNKGEQNHSYEIIQKAGDSHYFNTNMEKAYQWYNVLYEKYGSDIHMPMP